ncbi:MAG: HEAT repeat domain-containing protein [Planctomycetes bacterium]|nr:HEAT repeat domain-containing protein [Planctomycetota bacterium]
MDYIYDAWEFWWGFNHDEFYYSPLKARKESVNIEENNNKSNRSTTIMISPPSPEQIRILAIPALEEILIKESNRDTLTAALIAIAKIGIDPGKTAKLLQQFVRHYHWEVSEAACLALGILGTPEGVPDLTDILHDNKRGRDLVGQPEIHYHRRSFAAYALGLIGARTGDAAISEKIQSELIEFLKNEGSKRAAQEDIRIATIQALSLVPDPRRMAVAALREYFDMYRKREPAVCSHVPTAIAHLLSNATIDERCSVVQSWLSELAESGPSGD